MRETQPSRETVLITGASGGIGLEFARIFALKGHPLVLVARSQDKLEQIAQSLRDEYHVQISLIVQDLSKPLSAEQVYRELNNKKISPSILVNNAGFAGYGMFGETDLQHELEMMQLNMITLTHLTKLFLKERLPLKSGKILNIASTAAFQPGPLMAVYFATKAYVLSFSEALRNELNKTGITVTVLCPGPTASQFQDRARIKSGIPLFRMGLATAYDVARIGYEGLVKDRALIIPGFLNKIGVFLVRLLPRFFLSKIVRFLQE